MTNRVVLLLISWLGSLCMQCNIIESVEMFISSTVDISMCMAYTSNAQIADAASILT